MGKAPSLNRRIRIRVGPDEYVFTGRMSNELIRPAT